MLAQQWRTLGRVRTSPVCMLWVVCRRAHWSWRTERVVFDFNQKNVYLARWKNHHWNELEIRDEWDRSHSFWCILFLVLQMAWLTHRPRARPWICSQSGAQNNKIFYMRIDLNSQKRRLAAFPWCARGLYWWEIQEGESRELMHVWNVRKPGISFVFLGLGECTLYPYGTLRVLERNNH